MSEAQDPAEVWAPGEEDRAFTDVYGDWEALTPVELRDLLDGFPEPWWVVGGHAIEAFTGIRRVHEDIDLVIFSDHVHALRAHLGDRYHLWSNHGGTFRVIDDDHPEPLDPLSQIWLRPDARSPWQIDCILNPTVAGRWQSKRDPAHVAELEDVTWVADDGVRYLAPEVTLFFKAAQSRPKDEIDLAHAWPLLDEGRRAWLIEALHHWDPEHPWHARLVDGAPGTPAGTAE